MMPAAGLASTISRWAASAGSSPLAIRILESARRVSTADRSRQRRSTISFRQTCAPRRERHKAAPAPTGPQPITSTSRFFTPPAISSRACAKPLPVASELWDTRRLRMSMAAKQSSSASMSTPAFFSKASFRPATSTLRVTNARQPICSAIPATASQNPAMIPRPAVAGTTAMEVLGARR